jgi:hypothetical protein
VASRQTTLNSNVNTTKPESKALWDQWQLLDGFQWPSAQLLKYKERKKELISHIEWWSSPFFVNLLCSFYFQWSFPQRPLCLSKSRLLKLSSTRRIYTLNPSTTQRYHFCYRWYRFWAQLTSGNMFWMGVIMMMKVNKRCVTLCGLALYIIKYL